MHGRRLQKARLKFLRVKFPRTEITMMPAGQLVAPFSADEFLKLPHHFIRMAFSFGRFTVSVQPAVSERAFPIL
jgi:hypothetical protein